MARSPDVMNTRGQMDQAPALPNTQGRAQRDVMGYQPPIGPSNINDSKSPGLHGDNHMCGSQGSYGEDCETSGSPGIGGRNKGMGSNRRG